MGRVVFGMIANHRRPVGGVKVIYQAVGALRRQGIDAHVATGAGIPWWLASSRAAADAAVLHLAESPALTPADLYVATDAIGEHRMAMLLSRPGRRVLYIQNHNALIANTEVDWSRLRHLRCLTVSEYSRRYLMEKGGFTDVTAISPGVDLSVFRPAEEKRHRVAYMPRKWPGLIDRVRAVVRSPVAWLPIDGLTEDETAVALAGSTIFLNLGRREGFGLPPVEAMAAGCVVCGHAAEGSRDFATRENGFWAAEGDVERIARKVDAAVAAVADDRRRAAVLAAGRATAERYSLAVFEQRMAAYFRPLMA